MDISDQLKLLALVEDNARVCPDGALSALARAFSESRGGQSTEVREDSLPDGPPNAVLLAISQGVVLESRCAMVLLDVAERGLPLTVEAMAGLCCEEVQEKAFVRTLQGPCFDQMPSLFSAFGHRYRTQPGRVIDQFPASPTSLTELDLIEHQASFVLARLLADEWGGMKSAEVVLDFLQNTGLLEEGLVREAVWLFENDPDEPAPGAGMAWLVRHQLTHQLPKRPLPAKTLRL
jgi:hypothetical protein